MSLFNNPLPNTVKLLQRKCFNYIWLRRVLKGYLSHHTLFYCNNEGQLSQLWCFPTSKITINHSVLGGVSLKMASYVTRMIAGAHHRGIGWQLNNFIWLSCSVNGHWLLFFSTFWQMSLLKGLLLCKTRANTNNSA